MTLMRFLTCLITLLLLVPGLALAQDNDGDGRPAGQLDCDDDDPNIYLNADEICGDGVDQSCSGGDLVEDEDADGWVDERCDNEANCAANPGSDACTLEVFDCNDADETLNHDDEDGDGFSSCDNDCDDSDASIDPEDDDGDGFDDCSGDCDDDDAAVSPTGTEVCGDSLDNDCDGEADNVDLDGDGAITGDCGGDDCNDEDASLNPNVPESAGTCNDIIDNDCDETIDNLDEDCFEAPEAHAGFDIQDRYLGGAVVVVLDASGTTDFNVADTLTYTWTVEPDDGNVTLSSDPSAEYAYLYFSAAADSTLEWNYTASLTVSDGNAATDDSTEEISVRFWRPNYVPPKTCSQNRPAGAPSALALLLLLGASAVRRRRIA
ncbi:MAG: PKD domain-containing protein [Deltaproteobacteria bacterium]|nr:PKD domain-containing protein [Deltaproteobacteria bacterium]